MVKQWHQKSITEKLQWYNNEIGSLANYLELNEPYPDKVKDTFRELLRDITRRMEWDKQWAESEYESTNGEFTRYITVVSIMYDRLPTAQSNPATWVDKL